MGITATQLSEGLFRRQAGNAIFLEREWWTPFRCFHAHLTARGRASSKSLFMVAMQDSTRVISSRFTKLGNVTLAMRELTRLPACGRTDDEFDPTHDRPTGSYTTLKYYPQTLNCDSSHAKL